MKLKKFLKPFTKDTRISLSSISPSSGCYMILYSGTIRNCPSIFLELKIDYHKYNAEITETQALYINLKSKEKGKNKCK